MKKLALAIVLLLFASAAQAGVRNCNATLVGQTVCANTGNQVFFVDVTPAQGTRLIDAIALVENYQTEIGGQPNPETKTQFADRMLKRTLEAYMRRALEVAGEAAKQAAIAADPVPVIP